MESTIIMGTILLLLLFSSKRVPGITLVLSIPMIYYMNMYTVSQYILIAFTLVFTIDLLLLSL